MKKANAAAGGPSRPLILRATEGEVWFLGGAMALTTTIAVFAFAHGIVFPGLMLSLSAVIAGAAAVYIYCWNVVLDDQGVTVGGLMSQPPLAWTEVMAVQITEPFSRSPMRIKFVPRSGVPTEAVVFPLRRIVEDDRRRLVEFLAARGHQLQLGYFGWP